MWWIILLLGAVVAGSAAIKHYRWPLFRAAVKAQRAKANLVEKRVTAGGHDIVYLDGGAGEPLVLLHGFGANKDNWIQIAPLLAPHFRLIIPDLPGFGDSTRDPAQRYATDDQIERLRAFLEQLRLGPVHLGGNSMGGYLAGIYAARYSSDVKSLWLLAPAGVESAEKSDFFKLVDSGDNVLLVENPAEFKRLVDMCFTKTPWIPAAFRQCLLERNLAEHDFNTKVFAELFGNPLALEREMAACSVPTQILWGDDDRILHRSGADILGRILNRAETIVMNRMGHCPMLERPRETAGLYLKFQGMA